MDGTTLLADLSGSTGRQFCSSFINLLPANMVAGQEEA
jgi:hypothetical protein